MPVVYTGGMEHTHIPSDDTKEITIRLEQYEDIFSDFDIRPFSRRALSVDFLGEIQRASTDKSNQGIEFTLFVPEKKRDEAHEAVIKDRLVRHFTRHFGLLSQQRRGILRLGFGMVVLGIISMVSATLILYRDPTENLLLSFLLVFLEPAAWFLLWEGMAQIMFNSKSVKPELDFYRKMSHAKARIHFKTY